MFPVEHIRLSAKAKDQLITLKRYTGIKNWNVLCRWALCISLAEPHPPTPVKIATDSSVEMTWKVFGGANEEIYAALIRQRCVQDGLGTDAAVVAEQFKLHLHRGISYMVGGRVRGIGELLSYSAQ